MSFDDFLEFQNAINEAQKEQEQKKELLDSDKKDDFGFSEVLKKRQEKKDALKLRLEKLNFSQKEIDKLFKIIHKAEIEMEEIKAKFDYKSRVPGAGKKLYNDLIAIQEKMELDFNSEFNKMLIEKKNK